VPIEFNWDRWHIKQLEHFWEFDVLDAVMTVHRFSRPTSEIAEGLRETVYVPDTAEQTTREWIETNPFEDTDAQAAEGTDVVSTSIVHPQNALSLTVPLRNKINLALYAKAPRRLRCEIRYYVNPRSIHSRHPEVRSLTTDRFGNLIALLSVIADRSAERANRFLDTLWQRVDRPEGRIATLSTLLEHIASACQQTGASIDTLLPGLIAHGRVFRQGTEERVAAIDLLVSRRVLTRTRVRVRSRGREYAIARRYADVVEQLAISLRASE
jgi:hypothetical protein